MKLRASAASPFVRKVRVVAHELGIADRIELVPTALRTEDPGFWDDNPLAKIPVLTTDAGARYTESTVICEYLDATFGAHRLLPATGDARWEALTTIGLADGIVVAGMQVRQELARAPERRSEKIVAHEQMRMRRGLDRLQRDVAAARGELPFDLARIAMACDLGWTILRFGRDEAFAARAELARWYDDVSARPSLLATPPDAEL
jgi:glutathione S-transferase